MLFAFWRRWMAKDKVTLQVQVDASLRDQILAAATQQGMTLSAWLRQAAMFCLPKGETGRDAGGSAMDKAFDALDAANSVESYPGVMPLPPAAQAPTPTPPVVSAPAPLPVTQAPSSGMFSMEHPCAHMKAHRMPNMNRGQGHGVCMVQGGRECRWAANVARQCTAYRSARAHVPPPAPIR